MALVNPHGSRKILTPTMPAVEVVALEKKRAESLPRIQVSSREAGDIIMLGIGAFTPLNGFMGREDYLSCVEAMQFAKLDPGMLWPLPVTLSTDDKSLKSGDEVALYEGQELLATMLIEDIYEPDKRRECERCFMGAGSTTVDEFWLIAEEEHPGVQQVLGSGRYYLGGPVKTLAEKDFRQTYGKAYLSPQEARRIFEDQGWSTVAAFQTRAPIHRSQEYLCKLAQEFLDGLFIHAVVGKLMPDEIPGEVRVKCYQALIDNYFNRERTILGVYPMDMRYGGPREALLHAIIRQNFGCSHLLIGRDHAGVGDFYGLFEAQAIFDTLWEGALELQPLKVDWAFWSHKNNGMASLKTCPTDDPGDRVMVSGTKLKRLMTEGRIDLVPPEFSRPEVLAVLREYFTGLKDGRTVA